jgi:tetratricopeptide (TPR) repeat protein
MDEAVPHLLKAVEQRPQDPAARTNLVLALAMAGRAQEAIPHAQQAVGLSGGRNPLILDLLGRLYAQAGRLPEAIEATRQALEIALQVNDEPLARDLQARLSSYEAGAAGGRDRSARTRPR